MIMPHIQAQNLNVLTLSRAMHNFEIGFVSNKIENGQAFVNL